MLLQFTVRIRRFLLGGRFGIDVDSVLDLFMLLGSFLWDLLLFCGVRFFPVGLAVVLC